MGVPHQERPAAQGENLGFTEGSGSHQVLYKRSTQGGEEETGKTHGGERSPAGLRPVWGPWGEAIKFWMFCMY